MSTDKQIKAAYTNYKESLKPAQIDSFMTKDEIDQLHSLDFILPHFYKGDWLYKKGEWNKAELEWLKIYTLMPHAACKLGIMYRKQNRLEEENKILVEANNSEKLHKLYPHDTQLADRVKSAANYLLKHKNQVN